MNKTEENLVKAIEGGNYEKASKALSKFIGLQSTTDEQSNDYFERVESLQTNDEVIEEEVIEETEEVEVIEEEVIEAVAPRVEKRGLKAKSKSRKELEKSFNDTLEMAVNYFAGLRKERSAEAVFARKLVRRLSMVKKQVLR